MKREEHTGVVVENDDPEKRGRLNIECPTIVAEDFLEDVEPECFFVDSVNNAGSMFVPSIGSQVTVSIDAEPDSEIVGLNARWRCTQYPIGTVPEELTENYPYRHGWKTAEGHIFYFDDTESDLVFRYVHPAGTEIVVDNDGNIHLKAPAGKSVYVGDGADQALVRGNKLNTFLNSLKSWLDLHVHTIPTGTTSAPTVASTSVPADLLSDDHKVK